MKQTGMTIAGTQAARSIRIHTQKCVRVCVLTWLLFCWNCVDYLVFHNLGESNPWLPSFSPLDTHHSGILPFIIHLVTLILSLFFFIHS